MHVKNMLRHYPAHLIVRLQRRRDATLELFEPSENTFRSGTNIILKISTSEITLAESADLTPRLESNKL